MLCFWEDLSFLIVDLTFHGQWYAIVGKTHILPVGRRPSCSGSFAFLRSHTGFAHRTGASVEVVLARCNHCSSKLCLLLSPFEPRSLQQIRLHKNHNCGTVTGCHGSNMVLPAMLVHCRKVKPRGCTFSKAIQVCVGEALLFLIVDLTFHGQWYNIVPVPHQPTMQW